MNEVECYDPRYLAGIKFFNDRDFFEAHEVWEDVWHEGPAEYRRFYQGLIQAAVSLYHWERGNWRGAKRLFLSGRKYMSVYPGILLGLDIVRFWQGMEKALADVLGSEPPRTGNLDFRSVPMIQLVPNAPCR